MAASALPRITDEEYLRLERGTDLRHEFLDGLMYVKTGGTMNHACILAALGCEIGTALKATATRVAMCQMRVRVKPGGLYAYPDVVVMRDPPRFFESDTLLNPTLIAEVLSPSTESFERGLKFEQYREIASLEEYVLVSQTEPRVEVYRRNSGGAWPVSVAGGSSAVCVLESLKCVVPLSEIYRKVTF